MPYCQKHTPSDYFFGDFAHWELRKVPFSDIISTVYALFFQIPPEWKEIFIAIEPKKPDFYVNH